MNIVPKAGPALVSDNNKPSGSQDARARAIARLTEQPVPNATQVSPEEMTALAPTSEGQKDSNEPASDAAPEVTKTKEEAPLSSQYAILARKEKALRTNFQSFKAEQEAFKAEKAAFESSKGSSRQEIEQSIKQEYQQRLASDPLSVFAEAGFSAEQLTNLVLNPQKVDPFVQSEMNKLKEELKALRGETENNKKSQADQQSEQYKQAVAQIRLDTKNLVSQDPNYETIKATNSVDDVVELIEETYKSDGVLLTIEEAAQEVENYLVEEAMKIAKIKKIQQRLQPAPKQPEQKSGQQPMKTLTNGIGATRPITARERAIAAFKNEKIK